MTRVNFKFHGATSSSHQESQKTKSIIWKHVTYIPPSPDTPKLTKRVACNYCPEKFSIHNGATTGVRNHLRNHDRRLLFENNLEVTSACERPLLLKVQSLPDMVERSKPFRSDSQEHKERVDALLSFLVDNKVAPHSLSRDSTKHFISHLKPR